MGFSVLGLSLQGKIRAMALRLEGGDKGELQ